MKILVIGPSPVRSKGGMATVIRGIQEDEELNQEFDIRIHESFIDGSLPVRLLYSLIGYLKFLMIYRKYDLFHVHMVSNGSTFRKAHYIKMLKKHHKKIILHMHVAKYMEFYDALPPKKKEYVKGILKKADLIVLLSEGWRPVFQKQIGLEASKIVILNNGIDVETYQKAVTDVTKTPKEFLFLGRVGERKGSYDVVDALTKIKQDGGYVHCIMAGDGDVEKVRELAQKRQIEDMLELTGWIGPEQRMEYLKKVSTILLPSHHEGLPMTLLEGMAAGKAVITTAVGSIPELVENGVNGAVILPGDVDALKEKLMFFSNNPQMLAEMSKRNQKKIADEFSRRKMHQQLASFYRRYM